MIIEFELLGTKCLHKGVFETTGFWAKFASDYCDVTNEITTYKIYSHFSFTFEHVEEKVAKAVFRGLCDSLNGNDVFLKGVGFIREVI